MESTQKNAVGVDIIATIKEDDAIVNIATITTRQIILRKPDGTVIAKTATLVTDGTDGQMKYRTLANDLDQVGRWDSQGYVVFPSGFDGRSSISSFYVADNL